MTRHDPVARPRMRRGRTLTTITAAAVLAAFPAAQATADTIDPGKSVRTLDGSNNNLRHPEWGKSGTNYTRVGSANYADGKGAQTTGPDPRLISNRIFNDSGQNLFSERGVTQWGWTWGQFMDHVFGLAQGGGEREPMPFSLTDPLEDFDNDLGRMSFTRDAAAPGTGTSASNPREHVNTLSSYIDAFNVYGGTPQRLEWLREGPVDGDLSNNGPKLLLSEQGTLPRKTDRGDAATAPHMEADGTLRLSPERAAVAGDVRANENVALTDVHVLFAREHNRIVDALPAGLSSELKFQIARRVVGAEMQYVTYQEFLPAMGVRLPAYRGYKQNVNPGVSKEFATMGYRAHSQVHGEFELEVDPADYPDERRQKLESMGVEVHDEGDALELVVPLNVAFFNPDLVEVLGVGEMLKSLQSEPQYKNDEQIDNSMRSVMFGMPGPGATNPVACFTDPRTPGCFQGVTDLGSLDVQRGRDHGLPSYNDMREDYGLPRVTSFKQITGEDSEEFPAGIDPNSKAALEFTGLWDADGEPLPLGSQGGAVRGERATPLAARLKAIYGDVDKVEAFVGAYSEEHLPGSEMGELNHAVWAKQFAALRDGDRFFYANDSVLGEIQRRYGIDYRHSLADLIAMNTDVPRSELQDNVFFAAAE